MKACGSKKVTGWAARWWRSRRRPQAFSSQGGLTFTTDVTYADLPIKIHTEHGVIAGVPTTDFSDNRVMRASPRDFLDAHKGTFDYLVENEPMALHVLVLHCQFGGRPLMTSVIQELLKYMAKSPDVWFTTHAELAAGRSPPMSTSTAMAAGSSTTPAPHHGRARRCGDRRVRRPQRIQEQFPPKRQRADLNR